MGDLVFAVAGLLNPVLTKDAHKSVWVILKQVVDLLDQLGCNGVHIALTSLDLVEDLLLDFLLLQFLVGVQSLDYLQLAFLLLPLFFLTLLRSNRLYSFFNLLLLCYLVCIGLISRNYLIQKIYTFLLVCTLSFRHFLCI